MKNCAEFGYAVELSTRLSTRLHDGKVAKQGEVDTTIRFEINGKIRYIAGEVKTNGGRVNTLLDGSNKAPFVIYAMHLCNSTTKGKLREIPAVIIPTELFCAKLREFGALKEVRHNGVVDGIAIQPSNKAWYEWLLEYPMVYDKTLTWHEEDFDGLE